MSEPLMDDLERLADIGDQVLAGADINEFDLTPIERLFVVGYVRRGMGEGGP